MQKSYSDTILPSLKMPQFRTFWSLSSILVILSVMSFARSMRAVWRRFMIWDWMLIPRP